MKKGFTLLLGLMALGFLTAQSYQPIPEIMNLISLISQDSLQAHVQHLQDYQTRHALAGNQLQIATWISDQFNSYGFSNTYMQQYQHQGTTQYNVIATIPGYLHPECYVVVSAHYDSQSLNSSNYTWAPGADDNASGTAGLLEMARVMKLTGYLPRCTIRFIAFSAEEGMAYGSSAYCDYALSENHDIRISVNLDMIASNEPVTQEYRVTPFSGSPLHCGESIAFSESYSSLLPVKGEMNYGGDNMMFNNAGYPCAMFKERHLSPYWHRADDIIDHLDFQYALQIMRAATATTAIYANHPVTLEELRVYDSGIGNTLLAQWDSSDDPEVDHYAVFYGADADSMSFWQEVDGTQCQISGLEEGQYYHVAVSAVNSAGYPSLRVFSGGTPNSVPLTPTLVGDYPSTDAITISWAPNTELDLAGYNVFRRLGQDGIETLIGTVPSSGSCFTDSQVSSNLDYYYYRVNSFDSQGQQSPLSEALSSRMVSLDRGILVIDESKNFTGTTPFQPTDQAVDDFYSGLLAGYGSVQYLDLEEYSGVLRVADIGVYSSILWHGNDNSEYTYPHQLQDVLRQYINCGGKVLFSVYFPGKGFELNAGYPSTFESQSFIYDVLGISGVNYSSGARFKEALPAQPYYPAIQVDPLKTLTAWQGHMNSVEVLEPVDPEESIYLYGSGYAADTSQGVLNGSSVGLHHYYGAGQVLCLSFPLYNMQTLEVQAFTDYVFGTLFNEPSSGEPNPMPPVQRLKLHPNYPNPFSHQTSFRLDCPNTNRQLKVEIYNLRGQLVRTLYKGDTHWDIQLVWYGEDNEGAPVGSGIYFIRAETGKHKDVRKVLKMN